MDDKDRDLYDRNLKPKTLRDSLPLAPGETSGQCFIGLDPDGLVALIPPSLRDKLPVGYEIL